MVEIKKYFELRDDYEETDDNDKTQFNRPSDKLLNDEYVKYEDYKKLEDEKEMYQKLYTDVVSTSLVNEVHKLFTIDILEHKEILENIKKEIDSYQPYPEDVFTEIGKSDDARFGTFGRKVLNNMKSDLIEIFKKYLKEE